MPYKYVMAVQSTPFTQAPQPILAALQRLRWAGQRIGQTREQEFNEMLAVGYFEDARMGVSTATAKQGQLLIRMKYHDDGEVELGPTVATMALGAPAKMNMRIKKKYWEGYETLPDGTLKPDLLSPHIPGAWMAPERAILKDQVEAGRKSLNAAYRDFRAIHNRRTQQQKSPRSMTALSMVFNHGDIIIMHGAEMQKYYEVG